MMMFLVDVLGIALPFAAFLILALWLLGPSGISDRRVADRGWPLFSAVELVGAALMGLSLVVAGLGILRLPAVVFFTAGLLWLIYAARRKP